MIFVFEDDSYLEHFAQNIDAFNEKDSLSIVIESHQSAMLLEANYPHLFLYLHDEALFVHVVNITFQNFIILHCLFIQIESARKLFSDVHNHAFLFHGYAEHRSELSATAE